ncbi:MAG: hypothetical protein QOE23_825 [Pseudonocardiales bacterium]|jgi:hypothetical protein|nr:hypothetical protein [Pseudonocardiales bacterium]MEA2429526.1 hypothetical protein [Thermoleophilaceae bacterium]
MSVTQAAEIVRASGFRVQVDGLGNVIAKGARDGQEFRAIVPASSLLTLLAWISANGS